MRIFFLGLWNANNFYIGPSQFIPEYNNHLFTYLENFFHLLLIYFKVVFQLLLQYGCVMQLSFQLTDCVLSRCYSAWSELLILSTQFLWKNCYFSLRFFHINSYLLLSLICGSFASFLGFLNLNILNISSLKFLLERLYSWLVLVCSRLLSLFSKHGEHLHHFFIVTFAVLYFLCVVTGLID